jgi:hypothetical protein
VWLHHTGSFQQDQLWRYAADSKTDRGHVWTLDIAWLKRLVAHRRWD